MTHLMLDLETFGVRTNAAIVQLAAIPFTFKDEDKFTSDTSAFNRYIQVNDMASVDHSTLAWWLTQSTDAQNALAAGMEKAKPEQLVLEEFAAAFDWRGIEGLWSHGAKFDIPILQSAFERYNIPTPWQFRTPRDTRTYYLFRIGDIKPPLVEISDLTAHNALDDCVIQIRQVLAAHRS